MNFCFVLLYSYFRWNNFNLILYNTVYLQFPDIPEIQTTDGSLGWVSWGKLRNRSAIEINGGRAQMMSFTFFLRDQLKVHNLFHHRQPIKSTSRRSNIGSWKSKTAKSSLKTLERMQSQEKSDAIFDTVKSKLENISFTEEPFLLQRMQTSNNKYWHQNLWRIIHLMQMRIFH